MCEIWGCCHVAWCKRGEAVEKEGEGGGGALFESRPWYGKQPCWTAQHPGRPLDYIKGQIGDFELYHGCRPYDFCCNSVQSGRSPIHVFQRQESSTL